MENILRPFWNRFFSFNWKFGLIMILIICIPRFLLVLQTHKSGDYEYIGLIQLIAAITPFLFLNKEGRRSIGLSKPFEYNSILFAFIFGLTISILLNTVGLVLYPSSYENWYSYIGNPYALSLEIKPNNESISFSTMALIVMILSPIGEELFFRGIVHSSFAKSMGSNRASIASSLAFAVIHFLHFGLIIVNYKLEFLAVVASIWMLGMFAMSMLFLVFKKYTGSISGAIICHSAFNFGMINCLFFLM